jgi:hypothetical protein
LRHGSVFVKTPRFIRSRFDRLGSIFFWHDLSPGKLVADP